MKSIHYMSSLFAIVWLSHFEYDMAEIDDHEEIQSMIGRDYAKYLKSFSAQMDLTPVDCIKHFLNSELEQ